MTDSNRKKGKQSAVIAAKTRSDIISSATELFSMNGFDSTSLREIAAYADLAHGSIRHHFGSKLDIWKAVADQVLQHYQERLFPVMLQATQSDHHLDSFKNVVRAFIKVSNDNPVFAKLLMREGTSKNERSDYVRAHFLKMHTLIEVLFTKARAESPTLSKYTNDSFFLALLSLTFFPLILPEVTQVLGASSRDNTNHQQQLIFNTLFGEER